MVIRRSATKKPIQTPASRVHDQDMEMISQAAKKVGRQLVVVHKLKTCGVTQAHEYRINIASVSMAIYESTIKFSTFPFLIPHSHKIKQGRTVIYDRGIDQWEGHLRQKGFFDETNVLIKTCLNCDISFFDTSHQEYCFTCFLANQKEAARGARLFVKKAKALARKAQKASPAWPEILQEAKTLQSHWKALPPMKAHDNDKLWEAFRESIQIIFDARSAEFHDQENVRLENEKKARALITAAKAAAALENKAHATEKIKTLQQQWRQVHPLPRESSQELWDEFRGVCQGFFDLKKERYLKNQSSKKI